MKKRQNTLRRVGERTSAGLEYAYLLLFGLVLLFNFGFTTAVDWPPITGELARGLWLLLALVVGARTVLAPDWTLSDAVLAVLIVAVSAAAWWNTREWLLLEAAILAVGARGVDFRRLVKVYVCVTAAALLVTITLSLTGVIENFVYYREGRRRMSFGILYPTDFSAHVFFLAAAYAWLRERHIRWWEIGVITGLAVFCLAFCDARNSVACLVLLAAGLAYLKLRRTRADRKGKSYALHPAAAWIFCVSAPILAAVMVVLAGLYREDSGVMRFLDTLFSERLRLGHLAFAAYPIPLFGQVIPMTGWGGASEITEETIANYFFLDSSYVNVLFCFGIAALILVLALFVYAALREKRNASWERLGILAVAALQCMTEHHLLEFAYNIFLLLPMAVSAVPIVREDKK